MPTQTPQPGWHREDIKAGLRKKGISFFDLGRRYGYADLRTPGDVLRRPWPLMERRVAEILGVKPHVIWPDRYTRDGKPKGRGVMRNYNKLRQVGNSKVQRSA